MMCVVLRAVTILVMSLRLPRDIFSTLSTTENKDLEILSTSQDCRSQRSDGVVLIYFIKILLNFS